MTEQRLGAQDPCPHCGAHAGIAPDGAEYRCLVCGGPRIIVDTALGRPGQEKAHLQRAKVLRTRRAVWAVAGAVVGGFGMLSAAIALFVAWLAQTGAVWSGAMAILAAIPLLLGLFAWRKAKAMSAEARAEIERARQVAASELLAAGDGRMQAAELARVLHISDDAALQLLAESQVDQFLDASAGPKYRVASDEEAAEAVDAEAATVEQPVIRR